MNQRENNVLRILKEVVCMSENDFLKFCECLRSACGNNVYANDFVCKAIAKRQKVVQYIDGF